MLITRRLFYPVTVQPSLTQILPQHLRPNPYSHIKKKRVGRGGKRGGSSGRGNGGQKHHNSAPQPWFTGLYTNPIIHALPKFQWSPRELKPRLSRLNLERLQFFIDCGRLRVEDDKTVTMYDLAKSGCLIGGIRDGVKLLGTGSEYFKANIRLEVSKASKSAINAIERNGGTIRTVYHTKHGLDQLIRPGKYPLKKHYFAPINDADIRYYSNPENRGYLSSQEIYENEFKPRGYLNVGEQPENDYFTVQQKYSVKNGEALLNELKRRREIRQRMFEEEQEMLKEHLEQKERDWKNQKWFPDQADWKWIEINEKDKAAYMRSPGQKVQQETAVEEKPDEEEIKAIEN